MGFTARLRRGARTFIGGVATTAVMLLAACGGGGTSGPTFTLSTHQLSFHATSLQDQPSAQTLHATVSGVTSGSLYIRVAVTGDAVTVTNVMITGATTGQADVVPVFAGTLGPGRHTAVLDVYVCTTSIDCSSGNVSGSPQHVDVTYDVDGLVTDVATLGYAVGNTVVPSDLHQTVAVTSYPGTDWTATSDADWLVTTHTAGAGPTTLLDAALDADQVAALTNGDHTATLTITPATGPAVTVPVTLTIARTETRNVSPSVEMSGTSQESILRGDHLDEVQVTGVRFGDQPAVAFHVVNDTEIRATHPALPAGTYPVTVDTVEGIVHQLAVLTVMDPVDRAAAAIVLPAATDPWIPRGIVYDAPRDALIVAVQANDGAWIPKVFRYQHDASGWSMSAQQTVPGLTAIALSLDRSSLLLAATQPRMLQVDPVTLAVQAADDGQFYYDYLSSLPVTSDDRVVAALNLYGSGFTTAIKYDVRTHAFVSFPGADYVFDEGNSIGSGDGSVVLMASTTDHSTAQFYDATTGALSTGRFAERGWGLATDRTGSRFVVGYSALYDRAFHRIGALPADLRAVVMSPDGTHVHALDASDQLHSYLLSPGPGGTVTVAEIGTGTTLPADPGNVFAPNLALSPDARTLFIVGSSRVVIQPVPH